MNATKNIINDMIKYLEMLLRDVKDFEFVYNEEIFGNEDTPARRRWIRKMDAMIACKEMTEAVIGMPVNLGTDGKVTVEF